MNAEIKKKSKELKGKKKTDIALLFSNRSISIHALIHALITFLTKFNKHLDDSVGENITESVAM